MTEITDRIQEYHDHELAWDALVKYLTGRTYPPPDRYRAHEPKTVTTILEREGVDRYHDAGTWDEVIHARNRGLLTNDEYMKILEADQHRPKTTELGEGSGHAFRGNQHTGGIGSTARGRNLLHDAEAKIQAALPNATVDLRGMDARLVPTVVEHVQRFAAEYPRAAETMASFVVGSTMKNTSASTSPRADGTYMTLGAKDWGDETAFQHQLNNDDAAYGGNWLSVSTPGGVLDHELGHVLDFASQGAFRGAINMEPGAYSGAPAWQDAQDDLSEYANASGSAQEAFAEGFATYQAGEPLVEPYAGAMKDAIASAHEWEAKRENV